MPPVAFAVAMPPDLGQHLRCPIEEVPDPRIEGVLQDRPHDVWAKCSFATRKSQGASCIYDGHPIEHCEVVSIQYTAEGIVLPGLDDTVSTCRTQIRRAPFGTLEQPSDLSPHDRKRLRDEPDTQDSLVSSASIADSPRPVTLLVLLPTATWARIIPPRLLLDRHGHFLPLLGTIGSKRPRVRPRRW